MKKNNSRHEFTIKIEGEEWEKAQDNAFKKRNKEAKIDGFRPGKAPKDVFLKHYGKESLYYDAADSLLQKAYLDLLTKEKVMPVLEPKVDIKNIDETGVEFVFTVITQPELEIKKYKGLNIQKQEVEVTDEEVEDEIKHLLTHYQELIVKEDGVVENGDFAIIDYEGFKDGVAFEGGKAENYSLEIGSHTFIPGFEEQLIGMKEGEEKDIEVTFPEDYGSEELKGAKAVFKIKLHEVKVNKDPEFNEEFFEDLAMEGVDSKESLEDNIRKSLLSRKEVDAENKYIDALLDKIAENTEIDIPEEMVDEEVHHLIDHYAEQMKMQGISLDLYFEITKTTPEDLHKQIEPEAYKNVLYRLIVSELIKLENLEVTDEETNKELKEVSEKYGMTEEDFLKEIGGIELFKYDLLVRKLFDLLKECNK